MASKERCVSHMDMSTWGRADIDSRGYQRIVCRKCRAFIGWCPPQTQKTGRRRTKAQETLIDKKNQQYE